MKKRLEKLEEQNPKPNDKQKLIEAGREWRQAILDRDWQAAIEAREDAQPLFDQHPEWMDDGPYIRDKMLYIDFPYFAHFLEDRHRQAYRQAVEKNQWPPKTELPH